MEKQQSIDDILAEDEECQKFVEKFKPKKTTDDCYTPECIYEAVKKYCVDRYKIDPEKIVRPFWPGGDYEAFDYPDGCRDTVRIIGERKGGCRLFEQQKRRLICGRETHIFQTTA